jgi:hypothetical protein
MMDAGERELFAKAIAEVVGSADVDAGLASVGWGDALAADPRTAVSVLFSAQGRVGARSRALELVLGSQVLPALGRTDAPGRMGGDAVVVDGLALGPVERVATADAVVTAPLSVRPVSGLDPRLGLVVVQGTAGVESSTPAAWPDALAAGQRALAHELIGASRAMLALARDHAVERVQFDRPIAGFQAVRHRLADAYVAVEAAEAAADAAWDDGTPFTASLAKAIAGRSARTVAQHAQQVLAGIGFTAEHAFHHHLRRTRVLDALLGDSRTLTEQLGLRLLATRELPPLLPL